MTTEEAFLVIVIVFIFLPPCAVSENFKNNRGGAISSDAYPQRLESSSHGQTIPISAAAGSESQSPDRITSENVVPEARDRRNSMRAQKACPSKTYGRVWVRNGPSPSRLLISSLVGIDVR